MRRISLYTLAAAAVMTFGACTTFDCPLYNKVYAKVKLAGDVKTLADTLSVSIPRNMDDDGSDTVVINRLTATDSLSLPMSYQRDEDIYLFCISQNETGVKTTDTVWVEKQNLPHFESVDCNPAMFHTIKGVRTTHHAIDSIKINNDKVTYNDTKPHFLLYLKERNY